MLLELQQGCYRNIFHSSIHATRKTTTQKPRWRKKQNKTTTSLPGFLRPTNHTSKTQIGHGWWKTHKPQEADFRFTSLKKSGRSKKKKKKFPKSFFTTTTFVKHVGRVLCVEPERPFTFLTPNSHFQTIFPGSAATSRATLKLKYSRVDKKWRRRRQSWKQVGGPAWVRPGRLTLPVWSEGF